MICIGKRKALDLLILRLPELRPQPLAAQRRESGICSSKPQRHKRQYAHLDSLRDNVTPVSVCHAHIDNIRHNQRNHQFEHNLQSHARTAEKPVFPVILHITVESSKHVCLHLFTCSFNCCNRNNFSYTIRLISAFVY